MVVLSPVSPPSPEVPVGAGCSSAPRGDPPAEVSAGVPTVGCSERENAQHPPQPGDSGPVHARAEPFLLGAWHLRRLFAVRQTVQTQSASWLLGAVARDLRAGLAQRGGPRACPCESCWREAPGIRSSAALETASELIVIYRN